MCITLSLITATYKQIIRSKHIHNITVDEVRILNRRYYRKIEDGEENKVVKMMVQ